MRGPNASGALWLIDLAGATLFAWGIASGIAALAAGSAVPADALVALIGGGLMRGAAAILVNRVAIRSAQAIGRDTRRRVTARLLGEPLPAPVAIGEAATLALDHSRAIELFHARYAPIRFAVALAPLITIAIVALASLVAAGILLATLVPFVIGMILAGTLARQASERQLAAMAQLSALFVDRIRTLPIIRHFRAEERIARQVDAAAHDLADRTMAVLRAAFLSSAVLEFFAALSVALVAVYCGFSLLGLLPFPDPETLTFREAMFALAMAPEFYLPMRRLAAAYHEKQLGEAAELVLAELPEVLPRARAGRFAGLAVEGARIDWPGKSIGPVDLAIGIHGLVALTGPTGSGKTSLLAAIAGQVRLSAGSITPVAADDIAWAAQRPLILPGSLRDNLALARPAGDDELAAVVAGVGLAPMLARRGIGLDLPLDHLGSGLSGGERRRLALARAILAGRPLILADEPTADLDSSSAEAIIALLRALSSSHALIVATHDPTLVAVADREVRL
ncbi:ATP-binding cassette domain-containing protein [Sphingomonas sp. SFZ2018-12]|uniref:ABC transporter ATP-binding protein/permease n=1 Tax=Sphingomonas sp. SFZ2018-12 TaxID=2683197 RepID=UPI001F112A90|nr:ATP-binding cassette domain-containing protein [Sphingomonas sp. SFZ2018-12]MCH4894652.1 ATP-binding cassette domain-containing protein [Sphingomonas sp. SFZ2018-12]